MRLSPPRFPLLLVAGLCVLGACRRIDEDEADDAPDSPGRESLEVTVEARRYPGRSVQGRVLETTVTVTGARGLSSVTREVWIELGRPGAVPLPTPAPATQ